MRARRLGVACRRETLLLQPVTHVIPHRTAHFARRGAFIALHGRVSKPRALLRAHLRSTFDQICDGRSRFHRELDACRPSSTHQHREMLFLASSALSYTLGPVAHRGSTSSARMQLAPAVGEEIGVATSTQGRVVPTKGFATDSNLSLIHI